MNTPNTTKLEDARQVYVNAQADADAAERALYADPTWDRWLDYLAAASFAETMREWWEALQQQAVGS